MFTRTIVIIAEQCLEQGLEITRLTIEPQFNILTVDLEDAAQGYALKLYVTRNREDGRWASYIQRVGDLIGGSNREHARRMTIAHSGFCDQPASAAEQVFARLG